MAQHDDLVHAPRGHQIHFALHGGNRIGEGDVVTWAGQFVGVLRGQADQADLLAAAFDDGGFRQFVGQQRLGADVGVRHQDRKIDRRHERCKHFGTVVEFVVAHGHPVIA